MGLYYNLLTSQLQPYGGIISLMQYDGELFNGMVVPEGVDKNRVIDTIMQKYGNTPLYHEDPEYMKYYIPVWSQRNLVAWTKLYATTTVEYNPIENVDEYYSQTDKRDISRTEDRSGASNTKSDGTTDVDGTITGNTTNEHDVSAENASDYQPDSKDTGTESTTSSQNTTNNIETDTTSSENRSEDVTDTFTTEHHRHGNIGVMTTQHMLEEERRVSTFTIEDAIADSFCDTFCLLFW